MFGICHLLQMTVVYSGRGIFQYGCSQWKLHCLTWKWSWGISWEHFEHLQEDLGVASRIIFFGEACRPGLIGWLHVKCHTNCLKWSQDFSLKTGPPKIFRHKKSASNRISGAGALGIDGQSREKLWWICGKARGWSGIWGGDDNAQRDPNKADFCSFVGTLESHSTTTFFMPFLVWVPWWLIGCYGKVICC